MKTLLVAVVGLAVVGAGVVGLADLTQNRPDEVVAGSSTTVEFDVSTRDYQRGEQAAAAALWAVCASTVDGEVSPLPARHGEHWVVTITPAIGEHGENRLVGCLEDLTLDRALGRVVALHEGSAGDGA